jgi:hypothetical protein
VPAVLGVPAMISVLVSDGVLFGMAAWFSMPAFVGASPRSNLALMPAVRSPIPMLAPVSVSTVAAVVLAFPMTFALVRIASLTISASVATGVAASASATRVTTTLITHIGFSNVITAVMSVHVVATRHVHVHVHVARTSAHRIHVAPLVTPFGGLASLLWTGEPGDGPADGRGRLFGTFNHHADARAGQLSPHLIDGGDEIAVRLTGNDQQVRIGGADRHDDACPR